MSHFITGGHYFCIRPNQYFFYYSQTHLNFKLILIGNILYVSRNNFYFLVIVAVIIPRWIFQVFYVSLPTSFQLFSPFFVRSKIPRTKVFLTCIHMCCSLLHLAHIFPFLSQCLVVWKFVKCKMVFCIMAIRYVAVGCRAHFNFSSALKTSISIQEVSIFESFSNPSSLC